MEIVLGDKKIHIKKWKGRTKKNFTALINNDKNENKEKDIADILVYSCIEEDITLSPDEYKYMMSKIRAYSLGEEIKMEFYCEKCGNIFARTLLIKDIIRFTYKKLDEIKVKNTVIKLGLIKNKDFYLKKVHEDINYDFLLRIEKFNGSDTFTLDELEHMIDDLDIDILEKIMEEYLDAKFRIDDINTITCDCGKDHTYQFDVIQGFLPESWYIKG